MGSRKRSAKARQMREFESTLEIGIADLDSVFAREDARRIEKDEERECAHRERACTSKNRYASRSEAEEAILLSAEHGTRGLRTYRCEYCGGWHLTSRQN